MDQSPQRDLQKQMLYFKAFEYFKMQLYNRNSTTQYCTLMITVDKLHLCHFIFMFMVCVAMHLMK